MPDIFMTHIITSHEQELPDNEQEALIYSLNQKIKKYSVKIVAFSKFTFMHCIFFIYSLASSLSIVIF